MPELVSQVGKIYVSVFWRQEEHNSTQICNDLHSSQKYSFTVLNGTVIRVATTPKSKSKNVTFTHFINMPHFLPHHLQDHLNIKQSQPKGKTLTFKFLGFLKTALY